MRVVTVVCLSHFRKTIAKSLTLEIYPPLHHFYLDRACFSSYTHTYTQLQKEKNKIKTIAKPQALLPEREEGGRGLEGN